MLDDLERPSRGWVFYDGQCGFCSRWLEFWRPTLAKRGFAIAALQEPWVVARFQLPMEELVHDLRLLTRDGKTAAGADVYLQVTKKIWWAWPFYAVFSFPGFNWLIHFGYRWFARNRYHISRACKQS
jgi:predicted DCC family thiol-disulfide oxidoreductase YuxK